MAVIAAVSVSLDGFYTGPAPSARQPLGRGGDVLHGWFPRDSGDRAQPAADDEIGAALARTGALVMGVDSYAHAEALWGPRPPFQAPVFVLTGRPRPDDVRAGTTFRFVTGGPVAAIRRAAAAARGKDVALHGGGAIVQGLRAGLLDELTVHLVPEFLGGGRRLFPPGPVPPRRPRIVRVTEDAGVLHLTYRMDPP